MVAANPALQSLRTMLKAAAIFVVAAILAGQAMARPGACERPMEPVGMRGTG
jgi:hypothetical protein